jgi:hypothetical protein
LTCAGPGLDRFRRETTRVFDQYLTGQTLFDWSNPVRP